MRLALGILLYILAAAADILMTVRGMGGDLMMEGSPLMRAVMERFGILPGLLAGKAVVGLACAVIVLVCEPAIRRKKEWIYKLTVIPAAEAWMRRKRRIWVAYLPLYGTAVFQVLAALSWLAVG